MLLWKVSVSLDDDDDDDGGGGGGGNHDVDNAGDDAEDDGGYGGEASVLVKKPSALSDHHWKATFITEIIMYSDCQLSFQLASFSLWSNCLCLSWLYSNIEPICRKSCAAI